MIASSARRLWNVFVFLLCISSMTSDNDSETALRLNRSKYSKNIIFSYFIINSIRNTFDSVRAAVVDYVYIFIAAETKINESFPTAQFAIDGFHKPLRLDATNKSGGLLVYVRSYLPLHQLTTHKISSDIEALVFKINEKEKGEMVYLKHIQASIAKLSIFPGFIVIDFLECY